jgi:predicted metalloendopeptidase
MIQLRVTEIANELIGLFDQQSADLDGNGALKDWTQMQLEEYEHRRDRIRRLAEELATHQ